MSAGFQPALRAVSAPIYRGRHGRFERDSALRKPKAWGVGKEKDGFSASVFVTLAFLIANRRFTAPKTNATNARRSKRMERKTYTRRSRRPPGAEERAELALERSEGMGAGAGGGGGVRGRVAGNAGEKVGWNSTTHDCFARLATEQNHKNAGGLHALKTPTAPRCIGHLR
jgi:hypothetical protein